VASKLKDIELTVLAGIKNINWQLPLEIVEFSAPQITPA
jgi:hypothetical protein